MERNASGSKILTVYFSHSGNTRMVAERIHELAGGDLVEIRPADPYPEDYDAVVERAKREIRAGIRPAIAATAGNPRSCDLVLVGSPNWMNTVAPPVATFLSGHDLAGKGIAPFMTHEGTALGHAPADIARLCPASKVLEGLAIRGGNAGAAEGDIVAWLRQLGVHA